LKRLQVRIVELERDLAGVRQLLPDLEEIAIKRRRSKVARIWLAEKVPAPVRYVVSQAAPIVTAGVILYCLEHGWVQAITSHFLNH
jgi:hypothetical protein